MKTATYRVKSSAKINFGLRVLSKRKDGFHNIETIFYPVKLYDHLTIKITPKSAKSSRNEIKVKSNKNLIKGNYKVVISIRKNIPVGAGLGGGSSNAASVLKALAKYFNVSKKESKLSKLALSLGSDVPFFLLGKPAYAVSRGEKLTPLPKFKIKQRILIVNPDIQVSTKWAYSKLKIKNQIAKIKTLIKVKSFNLKKLSLIENDFEKVVFEKYPEIKSIKEKMYEYGAIFGSMSGSGSTIYGLFDGKAIKSPGKFFKSKGYKVFYC